MTSNKNNNIEELADPEPDGVGPYRRIFLMVRELHLLGYERLRVSSFVRETGGWRCSVIPACWAPKHPLELVKSPVRASEVSHYQFQYSSAQQFCAFGWEDAKNDSPPELAAKFIDRASPIAEIGYGSDPAYVAWFQSALEATAPHGVFSAVRGDTMSFVDGVLCETPDRPQDYLLGEHCSVERIALPPPFKPEDGETTSCDNKDGD